MSTLILLALAGSTMVAVTAALAIRFGWRDPERIGSHGLPGVDGDGGGDGGCDGGGGGD